jgi:methionine-rich copper-binding protein CopC
MKSFSAPFNRFGFRTKVVVSFAAALVGLGALVVGVSAHSRPVRFDPAPGAVLTSAPSKVDGWFTSDIRRDPNWSYIHVTDDKGNRVDTGDTALSSDRRQQTATLKSGLGNGMYIVEWRTFDDEDGAVFGDCYTFFVGQAAADAAVSNQTRLDNGSDCQRIDLEGGGATPTAAEVATATAPQVEGAEGAGTSSGGGNDVPVWGLVVGIIAGVVVGGVGGRFIGAKR